MHVFWLLGPFIMLIERSPQAGLSVIALTFAVRSIARREGWWLRSFCESSILLLGGMPCRSRDIATSCLFGETFVWFRFPLFAMAVAFWLGRDRRLVHAMLLSIGIGMMIMCLIMAAEISIVGVQSGRLSWPYGDLVPGNYLAKACLPAFVVVVAMATSSDGRTASWAALIALISTIASVMTGERINFLIRARSGMLAAVVETPPLSGCGGFAIEA